VTTILAIDPGNTESAYVVIDAATRKPLEFGKTKNSVLRGRIRGFQINPGDADTQIHADHAVIEMVASYGMAVGADVFETCVWIGRLFESLVDCGTRPELVKRHPVKLHHCHDTRAKDSNITQALVDRFALGQPNRGKGTKAAPGWFHGFAADIWQAYALAVYAADVEVAP